MTSLMTGKIRGLGWEIDNEREDSPMDSSTQRSNKKTPMPRWAAANSRTLHANKHKHNGDNACACCSCMHVRARVRVRACICARACSCMHACLCTRMHVVRGRTVITTTTPLTFICACKCPPPNFRQLHTKAPKGRRNKKSPKIATPLGACGAAHK